MKKIYKYHKDKVNVNLGDEVLLKGWFRKRKGRVIYVPGESELHKFFGDARRGDSLEQLGIELLDGTIYGIFIDPETNIVRENILFIKRGSKANIEIPEELDDEYIENE